MFPFRVSALAPLRDILSDMCGRFGVPLRTRSEARAEQLIGLVFRPTKTSTGDHKMADQLEDLGISAKPAPLLPPRPVPPHPADLLPPRIAAPQASTDSRADPSEPRQLLVGQGVPLSAEVLSCARLIIEGTVEANLT